ncbi:hypothetical protein K504DRAFT_508132 [Pleomassaria siparia CBS 279.74]|uniref:Uncharacterized protein n=1 Tax=Pleomassaria siparia CBS 279.74 TaxID=1314801 RepID=A0A6G1JSS4_9PLEO|nr:hypothetical protein K504DRAFT_508132 [Pleomassaria siparia CBS 279.74]
MSKSAINNQQSAFQILPFQHHHTTITCFAAAMVEEMDLKPWCHTTSNEALIEAVLENQGMELEPWD